MAIRKGLRLVLVAGFAAQLSVPAVAEPGSVKPTKDPNQVICEKQEVLGSRLAVRRVCMTRAQWAEQRRTERDLVQNSQLNARQKNPCNRSGC
jgi:hypothetical protein